MRGDPRGWRAGRDRGHVEGDYNHPPPPGTYDALYELSKSLMTRDPVRIAKHLRKFVVDCIVDKLRECRIEVIVASVDAKHLHLLARFRDHNVRHWVGLAKKNASHCVRRAGLRVEGGGLWAKRCHPEPVTGRAHQLNTFRYIRGHARRGAAVWCFTPARS